MLLPPPGNDDKNGFSEKRIPPANSSAGGYSADEYVPPAELADYVRDRLEHGSTRAEVRGLLVAKGFSEVDADRFVEQIERQTRKGNTFEYPSVGGNANMWIGGLICLVGIVVTVGSCLASADGGRYVVAWGAIVFGGIQFFRGLTQQSQS